VAFCGFWLLLTAIILGDISMTRELAAGHKALSNAKKQFVSLTKKTTAALGKERNRLIRDIKRANAKATKVRLQMQKKAERRRKSTTDKVKRKLKSQMVSLDKTRKAARAEAKQMRSELAQVRSDLSSARHHLAHALHIDKAMIQIEKKMEALRSAKATKKTAKKKRKKKAAKKKTTKLVVVQESADKAA
jgi:hypothetical protein